MDQVKAYERIMQCIPVQFTPRTHMMDNKASKGLKDFLVKDNNIQYQLVPPHISRDGNLNLQESLHCRIVLNKSRFPATIMG
jgi:hypothetical protein